MTSEELAPPTSHPGFQGIQSGIQSVPDSQYPFGSLDMASHVMHARQGDLHTMNNSKPFSLPSLASLTATLSPASAEISMIGPHRVSNHFSVSNASRRFSPLGNNLESNEAGPLDEAHSTHVNPQLAERKHSVTALASNRPRSRSLRSVQSFLGSSADGGTPHEESGSESGKSDKRKDLDDSDVNGSAKKRSRTLTTPTQQRRLMQILEQTRFPSTDLREQLARELGMTPRRVQIWFQNRRQGMKKMQEQRPEQDATTTSTEYSRSRGYSFGAYPNPPETFPQQQQQPPGYSQGIRTYTPAPPSTSHPGYEPFSSHLYAPRSLVRDGMPGQLPQLQLQNAASSSSLSTLNESACSDFSWSEPSATSSNWNGSNTAYALPATASMAERERMFPFGKQLTHPYASENSQGFSLHGSTTAQEDHVATRNRSQTNPDFFQYGALPHSMQSSSLCQPGMIHQAKTFHAFAPYRKMDEHTTPTQRVLPLDVESSPDQLHRSKPSIYDCGLPEQLNSVSNAWNDDLAHLKIADPRPSHFSSGLKSSPDRHIPRPPAESHVNHTHNMFTDDYAITPFSNDSMTESSGEGSNGANVVDYVGITPHSHLHLTEPHLIQGAGGFDTPIDRSGSPGHYRQRSRSFNG